MSSPTQTHFLPTRWTLVLAARGDTPEGRAALGELCESYWQPVFRFLRRDGRDEEAARELTQEFFARVLARGGLGSADPARGRFRSYLLGALKHFLVDQRSQAEAAKRGGGVIPESWDGSSETDAGVVGVKGSTEVPDTFFDRHWAYAIMERALRAVEREFHTAGREDQFAVLKPWLVGDTSALSQSEAARQLGLSEGAVKVAVHRLRRRFREWIRAEVEQTVDAGQSVDEELRYLVEVLSTQEGQLRAES